MSYCEIYTDGGCRNNGAANAVAGIGICLIYSDAFKETFESYEKLNFLPNTNQKAELYAAITGINVFLQNEDSYEMKADFVRPKVKIYSDSAYLINGITSWIDGWKRNGWKNSKKENVANRELWEMLDLSNTTLKRLYDVEWCKVKGHSGDIWNERVDQLANMAMDM